ncbi:MAG TPA: matrixin family metalloprotease [Thermoanaerobaculia bacterium]|nr:matrixin family metalloprotease [Thermoanaerobaculia bacterium]
MTYDINGHATAIEWAPTAFPLPYEVDQRLQAAYPGISPRIDGAFEAWSSIEDSSVRFEPRGVVAVTMRTQDGRIGVSLADDLFRDQGALAMTTYTFDATGRFLDADIQIDPSLMTGNYNVDTALRHEVGHVLGLDHSGVLSAVMYPFVTTGDTPIAFDSDDRIIIAATYPRSDPTLSGATLQGRVLGDQGGIYAAQVVAVNAHGHPVSTVLTSSSGEFTLTGIPKGRYRVYAEPLDGPVDHNSLQGTWRLAKPVPFPTRFHEGPPLDVESGKVYGNLVVTTGGAVQLNPRWIGRAKPDTAEVSLGSSPLCVKAGETITLAVAGDGFISGMTEIEILSPGFRRVSEFRWAGNYVSATYVVAPDVEPGSAVILVRSGSDRAMLTGALRISTSEAISGGRRRAARH